MQKKLIALAVAGLVAAPAFAQSNVTIYGIADISFKNLSDNVVDGVGSRNSIDTHGLSSSRIGFKGTEDLGNGLKALFVMETGINMDNGGFQGGGFHRQTFAGLTGGFGTAVFGRQYTPQFDLINVADPFGTGTVGSATNIYTVDTRLNNLAAYVSPSFSGLTVTAGYTFAGTADETVGNDADAKVWAIYPKYSNGPVTVGLNYHKITLKAVDTSVKVWDLGGSYDFGMVKLGAIYGQRKVDGAEKLKHYGLGVTVPVAAGVNVLASYFRAKLDDDKTSQFALGATYDLSKRTNVYAAYSDINNDGLVAAVGDAGNSGLGYQRGIQVGIRHKF